MGIFWEYTAPAALRVYLMEYGSRLVPGAHRSLKGTPGVSIMTVYVIVELMRSGESGDLGGKREEIWVEKK